MRMPQSLRNLQNLARKFINKISEAICCLCGIAAVLAIMISSGYLVSLLSVPTISIIIVACVTPLYFGYKEIFDAGYNFPGAVIDFLAASFKGLVNRFKAKVLGMEVVGEEPEYVYPNNINPKQNTNFLTYVKSWCPSFMCCTESGRTTLRRDSDNLGLETEEKQGQNNGKPEDPRNIKGCYYV